MRPMLKVIATLFIAAVAASLQAAAQQPAAPPAAPAQKAEPAAQPAAKVTKKRRTARARHRRARHASRWHRDYDPCAIINGWRAFPTRDRDGYFNTDRVRCVY
jgi:hypothetical protein